MLLEETSNEVILLLFAIAATVMTVSLTVLYRLVSLELVLIK